MTASRRCDRGGVAAHIFAVLVIIGLLWVMLQALLFGMDALGLSGPPEYSCDEFGAEEIADTEHTLIYTPHGSLFSGNQTDGVLRIYENGSFAHTGPAPIQENSTLHRYGPGFYVFEASDRYVTLSFFEYSMIAGPANETPRGGGPFLPPDSRDEYEINRCSVDVSG